MPAGPRSIGRARRSSLRVGDSGPADILVHRGLDRGTDRAGAPADVLPLWPAHLRPRQAGAAVGAGDLGGTPGPGLPLVPGGAAGLGRPARPVRVLWRDQAHGDARAGRVPGLRARARRAGRASMVERRALSSEVEHSPYKRAVGGSSPPAPTSRPLVNSSPSRTFGDPKTRCHLFPYLRGRPTLKVGPVAALAVRQANRPGGKSCCCEQLG